MPTRAPRKTKVVIDPTGFTDADWEVANQAIRAFEEDGEGAFHKVLTDLAEVDAVRAARVMGGFDPVGMSNAVKDLSAELGITREDIAAMIEAAERKRH